MTITNSDIVLVESQVMADTQDGGGRMSGRIIEDNKINNTFPDISRFDRVYGRTQLRKMFLAVLTANQDTLLGSHTIINRLPADPNVHVVLFDTGSHTDRRTDARDRIESYVVKSTEAPFWLWGKQLQGQRAIACLARLDATQLPEPGQVYALTDNTNEQYVRVIAVEESKQSFTIQTSNGYYRFSLKTMQVKLAAPLQYDFQGSDPDPTGRASGATIGRILTTQVADAAKYYGAAPLTSAASVGDRQVQVNSIYAPLVPAAQSETPLTDRSAGPAVRPIIPAANEKISVTQGMGNVQNGQAVYHAGRAIVPGTLSFTVNGGVYKDDGGKLAAVSGRFDAADSTIDYAEGTIRVTWNGGTNHYDPATIQFIPGAPLDEQSYQASDAITLQTRSLNFVKSLAPIPAPGTTVVEYRALGRWYSLKDTGTGALEGDGTGTIKFDTGTINVTLAALPDVGTEIIYSWGETISTLIFDGQTYAETPAVEFNVSDQI